MYIRVLCTIIYQSDDLALSASDKSCTLAMVLQPYGRWFEPTYIRPQFSTRWTTVQKAAKDVASCLRPAGRGQPAGGYIGISSKPLSHIRRLEDIGHHEDKLLMIVVTSTRPAALYMFTTDSTFNKASMKDYIVKGQIFNPPSPPTWLQNSSLTNDTSLLFNDTPVSLTLAQT